tara:strand:- start:1083 stop:1295 length:213 start_codon:yes stop_codon:yes gene_type:complete
MGKDEMIKTLQDRGKDINTELVTLQQQVTTKREQLLRIEGALEALNALSDPVPDTSTSIPGDSETEGTEE